MAIKIDLPELEQAWRQEFGDLETLARDALLIEMCRLRTPGIWRIISVHEACGRTAAKTVRGTRTLRNVGRHADFRLF